LLKFAGNVAYSAAVRLSSVLEVVLLLEEEEGRRSNWKSNCSTVSSYLESYKRLISVSSSRLGSQRLGLEL